MFNTLEEQIAASEGETGSRSRSLVRYAALLLVSVMVFGGLYLLIRFVD